MSIDKDKLKEIANKISEHDKVKKLIDAANAHGYKTFHNLHFYAYSSYFGAVTIGNHEIYAISGGFLLILTIIGFFVYHE